MSVPCPMPVRASEPYRLQPTFVARSGKARMVRAKSAAARIGPTVCELDGPMPMVNISAMLIGR